MICLPIHASQCRLSQGTFLSISIHNFEAYFDESPLPLIVLN